MIASLPIDEKPEYVPHIKAVWTPGDLFLIALVVLLAVAAALLGAKQFQHRRAIDQLVEELGRASLAFEDYMATNVSVPAAADFGEAPKGQSPFLTQLKWGEPTPVGGYYRWLGGSPKKAGTGASGRLALAAFPPAPQVKLSHADLVDIDQRIDDGDLATGNFRVGFNGWPILTLRAKP